MENVNKMRRDIVSSYVRGTGVGFTINPEGALQERIQEKGNGGISYESSSSHYANKYDNNNKTIYVEVDPDGVFIQLTANFAFNPVDLEDGNIMYSANIQIDTCRFKQEGSIVTMTKETFIRGGQVDRRGKKDDWNFAETGQIFVYEVPTNFKFIDGLKDAKLISIEEITSDDQKITEQDFMKK